MNISVFEIFKIGIGPSSSHTVGPMKAARDFVLQLQSLGELNHVNKIVTELFGSLALTGKGHGTDKAIIMGLAGERPDTIDPDHILPRMQQIIESQQLQLLNQYPLHFDYSKDLLFHYNETLPKHTNGMRFTAYHQQGELILSQVYYSVGGGFIVTDEEFDRPSTARTPAPYTFSTAHELLQHCRNLNISISELMMLNEKTWRSEEEIRKDLQLMTQAMEHCIKKGCETRGILPGGLNVRRRAAPLYAKLLAQGAPSKDHPEVMNWLNAYAMAVNEENAAGGRVVTAPTNGAAGIIPAVLEYYKIFCSGANEQGIIDYLLTAAAIAILYKLRASISGAEVGCQGEVGVACSMAAGALAAVLGGTLAQVENAAEIGMEHNLGLPCDPPKGLVQIPCIERNAMGAVKAVNAACLALAEDGQHKVSLDTVIATMRQIGKDMSMIYKETSLGGLAVNIPEC